VFQFFKLLLKLLLLFEFQFQLNYLNLKIEISILNYYFQIFKLVFQFQKLLIDYKNGHFNFEYFNVNMRIYISTLKTFHFNLS